MCNKELKKTINNIYQKDEKLNVLLYYLKRLFIEDKEHIVEDMVFLGKFTSYYPLFAQLYFLEKEKLKEYLKRTSYESLYFENKF